MPTIIPHALPGDFRSASLFGISAEGIEHALGFPPNADDEASKVSHSWGFTVDGERCGVWCYRGSEKLGEWSAFGPVSALRKVFGSHVQHD